MLIGVAFGLMGAFFMGGLYVAGAIGALSLIIMWFFSDAPLWNIMGSIAWSGNTDFILVAIPLFVLMGELMNRSGIGERMYAAVSRWIWFLPGGLIHTNIASSAIFSACSGSSVTTAATVSRVALPSFTARGYDERMVLGSLAAGGTLGILIPPSVGLIIYAVLVQESIGRLYLAGFLPGFMLAGLFMIMIIIVAKIWPGIAPREGEGQSFRNMDQWRERIISLVGLIPVAGLIFAVLGTIYLGIATPTEAASFGVSIALLIGIWMNSERVWKPAVAWAVRRTGTIALLPGNLRTRIEGQPPPSMREFNALAKHTWDMLQAAFLSTARTTGMIFLIILAAFMLNYTFARLGISQQIADTIIGLELNEITLVIVLVFFYLVLGTFMESFVMLLTTIPILLPTLQQAEVDLVWFGIIMIILLEAALISPPEGLNLYVLHGTRQEINREVALAQGVAPEQRTIADVWIGVLPFMACMGVAIALIIAFPEIALWLPNLKYGARGE